MQQGIQLTGDLCETLLGRGSAEAAVFGDGLRGARLPLARMKPGGHVRVVVIDERGKRAWSNPLWLD